MSQNNAIAADIKPSAYFSLKKKVFTLLDHSVHTGWSRVVSVAIISMIVLNTVAVIAETVDEFTIHYHHILRSFDLVSVTIFSAEYILRLWTCTVKKQFRHPVLGRIKYMLTPGALVDLLAIFPFYLPFLFGTDLRFIRTLRLALFFRFLKLGRYMAASRIILKVVREKQKELAVSLLLTLFLIMFASCLMYYVEHHAQPDKFSNIPETMWWSVCTLTTVGYGDMYPISALGKFLTAIVMLLGVGMLALPTGILASGFSEEFHKIRHKSHYCPHCGEKLP